MRDLPPPLPPGERTVGQLVGETIRAYGNGFLHLLPLGLPLAVVDQLSVHRPATTQAIVFWVAAPFVVGAYVYACSRIYDVPTVKVFLSGVDTSQVFQSWPWRKPSSSTISASCSVGSAIFSHES